MAKQTTSHADNVRSLVSGTLGATGESDSFVCHDANGPIAFNAALWGTFTATVKLQRSFDGGTTWLTCSTDSIGTECSFTAGVSLIVTEPERDVLYRWACTAYTSGTINYRISK